MQVQVSSEVIVRLLAEAASAHPEECCGILLGDGQGITSVVPAANVHPEPERHFEIDPQVLVDAHRAARQGGPGVLGYYHSHPNGRTRPSPEDRKKAARDGAIWAIIAAGRITLWRSGDADFVALPYEAAPR